VLGANDGIVSTASLVLGVAASGAAVAAIVTAGIAGLGALSMAAGEYVSVSSQRDAERVTVAVTLVALGLLGGLGARMGGAPWQHASSRVVVGARSRWRSPPASARSSARPACDGRPAAAAR